MALVKLVMALQLTNTIKQTVSTWIHDISEIQLVIKAISFVQEATVCFPECVENNKINTNMKLIFTLFGLF